MADDSTPFDPSKDIYSGISVLSTNDWLEMTTFFDWSVISSPTTEAKMRATLGMDAADPFRDEFVEAVGLFGDLKTCGEMFKTDVEGKMLVLADDIVHYNDSAGATYDRLIELVDKFDWDGAPTDATPDDKWKALIGVWNVDGVEGRSKQIRDRFASALDALIAEASIRAEKADALQRAILAPDGITARLKTCKLAFAASKIRFDKAFGAESDEMVQLRSVLKQFQGELKALQKKESDEVIVLASSPVYLAIPIFGPLIMAGVEIGVGVDLALTREKIKAKLKEIAKYAENIGVHERFNGYYTTASQGYDRVIGQIDDLTPKIELLGRAWRAIASDLENVRNILSKSGTAAVEGENWFALTTTLSTAQRGWARIAGQADRFRKFGGAPKAKDNVVDFFAAAATQAA